MRRTVPKCIECFQQTGYIPKFNCKLHWHYHGQEVDLDVPHVNGKDTVTLRNVWSVKRLPISTQSAAVNADIKRLPYLTGIDVPRIDTNNVMLLIGTHSPGAHIPLEVRSGDCDQPYAIRRRLGWAIRGSLNTTCTKENNSCAFLNNK